MGTWLSRDPLTELAPDGVNLYGYAGGDCVNRSDSLELFSFDQYASCIERYRNPITEQLPKLILEKLNGPTCAKDATAYIPPTVHIGNAVLNKIVGDTGRVGIGGVRPHATSWQHKLGGFLQRKIAGNAGKWIGRFGRFAGRASIVLTVFEGAWDVGLLGGCAIEQAF